MASDDKRKPNNSSKDTPLESLLKLGKLLLSKGDIHVILSTALEAAMENIRAQSGLIGFVAEDGSITFEVNSSAGRATPPQLNDGVVREIITKIKTEKKAFRLLGAKLYCEVFGNAKADLTELNLLCLPLAYKGSIFGIVCLGRKNKQGAFDSETAYFAELFAEFISFAAYHGFMRQQHAHLPNAIEKKLRARYNFDGIVAQHSRMLAIFKLVAQVANSEATVLIQGESGTGKELIARALHRNSGRCNKPFVPINCGAFSESLLDSELFGHVQGAFTGAGRDKSGWFALAEGGTIFLDEVSEMCPAMQVKLLRVLQFNEYAPVGSTELRQANVRIVAATHKDLEDLVSQGTFREDLSYRLNVIDLELPPLRQRRTDIPLLSQHFIAVFNEQNGTKKRLSSRARAALLSYDFPGNVRQLENAIQRGVALSEGDVIEPQHLPKTMHNDGQSSSHPATEKVTLAVAKRRAADKVEQDVVTNCLEAAKGHISNAARIAGIDVSNYHKILRKHHINPFEFKRPA